MQVMHAITFVMARIRNSLSICNTETQLNGQDNKYKTDMKGEIWRNMENRICLYTCSGEGIHSTPCEGTATLHRKEENQ